MSLKTKRHKKQRNSSQNTESNVQQGTDFSMSGIGGQARSAFTSVRDTASGNKKLLGVIGAGAGIVGAAVYALRTERGHAVQERIGETLTDSMGRIRELSTTGWSRIRDVAMNASQRIGLTEEVESDEAEFETNQRQNLRRVV